MLESETPNCDASPPIPEGIVGETETGANETVVVYFFGSRSVIAVTIPEQINDTSTRMRRYWRTNAAT